MSLTKATYSMIEGAPVNVLDFGAVGDNVTDDTAAIQAAIDSLTNNGGGILYLPAG
jgi:polygalacturonase